MPNVVAPVGDHVKPILFCFWDVSTEMFFERKQDFEFAGKQYKTFSLCH
jgi:hypothetical protein